MTPLDLTPDASFADTALARALVESALVFPASDIRVSQGVNRGDGLGAPDEVVPDDIYRLASDAVPRRLVVSRRAGRNLRVAHESEIGTPDAPVTSLARYHLMARTAEVAELLLLELGDQRAVLPLTPIAPKTGYALLAVAPHPGIPHLAEPLGLSLARGTMVTFGDGTRRPVEALAPGNDVLTRDHGRQPLRWLGHVRLRAAGVFAPVVVTTGALGNGGELILGQNQRLFLYRSLRVSAPGTAVESRDLVDGERIYLRESGWTDYYTLVFDAHEIIYAEGVPTESLRVSRDVVNRLPPDLAADLRARFPGLNQPPHFGTELAGQRWEASAPAAPFPTDAPSPRVHSFP